MGEGEGLQWGRDSLVEGVGLLRCAAMVVSRFIVAVDLLLLLAAFAGESLCLQFTQDPYSASVNETAPSLDYPRPPDNFLLVSCTNTGTVPGDVMYNISSDCCGSAGPFSIDPSSGGISSTADLDYDTDLMPIVFSFEVSCASASIGETDTARVEISVESVNEYSPTADLLDNSTTINETAPAGTIVAGEATLPGEHVRYAFSDQDRGPDGNLTYSLSASSQDVRQLFDIDPSTGTVTTRNPIDLDSSSSAPLLLTLEVIACDQAGLANDALCARVEFLVVVEPVNDHHPEFTQETYATFNTTYLEQEYHNEHIVSTQCTDEDRHDVGTLAGIELWNTTDYLQQVFLVRSDGRVYINGTLDYEQYQSVNLTLRCTDTGGFEDFSTIIVMVTARNDHSPRFQQSNYSFSVDRIELPGESIGQVLADDPDGDTVTYSMDSNSYFDIDEEDGTITLTSHLLAAEVGGSVEVTVHGSDGEHTEMVVVDISVDGPLSVLDLILLEAGFVLLLLLCTAICCAFWCLRKRRIEKSKRRPQSYQETQAKVRSSAF